MFITHPQLWQWRPAHKWMKLMQTMQRVVEFILCSSVTTVRHGFGYACWQYKSLHNILAHSYQLRIALSNFAPMIKLPPHYLARTA